MSASPPPHPLVILNELSLISVIFRWIIEAMKQRLASRALGVSSVLEETSTFLSLMLLPKVDCVCVAR